ncbi:Oidioi.mRNA.OKI2018_I69.chr2.g5369.t1.cds [Oikopleura dioica]|uniref:Oidioi.mRNA.OKI2018_I69.chr2.g5369.t1.cds n=1 Tax=Oikopleura dioica TaxID=34765 RepID=A0ABN7T9A8_OIKDI|nr:Oidioi.mRNA.OKI2018_I69.chr2.g5369.t1.cds [Oikopleura dioica]
MDRHSEVRRNIRNFEQSENKCQKSSIWKRIRKIFSSKKEKFEIPISRENFEDLRDDAFYKLQIANQISVHNVEQVNHNRKTSIAIRNGGRWKRSQLRKENSVDSESTSHLYPSQHTTPCSIKRSLRSLERLSGFDISTDKINSGCSSSANFNYQRRQSLKSNYSGRVTFENFGSSQRRLLNKSIS